MLNDNVKARVMDYNGEYHKKVTDAKQLNSQEYYFAEAYCKLGRYWSNSVGHDKNKTDFTNLKKQFCASVNF